MTADDSRTPSVEFQSSIVVSLEHVHPDGSRPMPAVEEEAGPPSDEFSTFRSRYQCEVCGTLVDLVLTTTTDVDAEGAQAAIDSTVEPLREIAQAAIGGHEPPDHVYDDHRPKLGCPLCKALRALAGPG